MVVRKGSLTVYFLGLEAPSHLTYPSLPFEELSGRQNDVCGNDRSIARTGQGCQSSWMTGSGTKPSFRQAGSYGRSIAKTFLSLNS